MSAIWETVSDVYDDYMANGDPRVTKWFLMESPVPTCILVAMYVAFVKVIGPAWMMDKKPYDLRWVMFAYNMGLVIASIYLTEEALKVLYNSGNKLICRIDEPNDPYGRRLTELGWWFFILKFVEFADTVFFILRKKFKQISTLHVVHHAIVPISVWFGFRVEPGNYNYFFPLINTIVHAVMYTYYGLSALGPHAQKYLWWKKYLTTFQMAQFVMVFLYIMSLMFGNCKVSKFIIYLNIFLAGLFLLMFYDYFRKTYIKRRNILKRDTKPRDKDETTSFSSQKICDTFTNQLSEQSLEKKIG